MNTSRCLNKYPLLLNFLTSTLLGLTAPSLAQAQQPTSVPGTPDVGYAPQESQRHPGIFVVAALGDSITAAMDATRLGNDPVVSFATGTDPFVGSHAWRLQQLMPHLQVRSINVSVMGAKSDDLARQATEAARYFPDYATILMGANDACSFFEARSHDLQRYVNNMAGAINTLIQSNPAIQIRLIPVPNIRRLYELGASQAHCRVKWSLSPMCRPMLSPLRSAASREDFFRLVDTYNAYLNVLAQRYPNNTTVSWNAAVHQFQLADVSQIDCFHPSHTGHRTLSWLSFGEQ